MQHIFNTAKKLAFLLFISVFFNLNTAQATHIVGADMSYKGLGNNQYLFTLNVFRDCGSTIPIENKQTIYYYSVSCNKPQDSLVLNGLNDGIGTDISPVCARAKSNCKGGTTPGVEKFSFQGTVTLSTACKDWIFYYKECNRSAGILTVQLPQLKCLYIEARLNNVDAPNNSSPSFQNEPVSFVCFSKPSQLNNGAIETDGDQMRFRLIAPRTNSALPGQPDDNFLVYKTPFSANSPLPTSGGFSFDSITGTMAFTPSAITRTVTALLVSEYRNGILIGSVMRDLQILVQNCNNSIPILKGIGGGQKFSANVCVGIQNNIYFPGFDPDPTDSVRITWNNSIPGANFFSTYKPRRDSARLSWTPTLADTGVKLITLTITDNSCPTLGSSSASYALQVKPSPKVELRGDTSLNCGVTIPVTARIVSGLPPYKFDWSGLPDTTQTVNLGNGFYSVTLKDRNGCSSTDNINILGGANTSASISVDSLCANQLATLKATISSLPVGVTLTYLWKITPSQPEFTSTLASPTYRFQQPGEYEIFLKITGSNNCTYTVSRTITICSPPSVDFELDEVPCLGQPVRIKLNSNPSPGCNVQDWLIKYKQLSWVSPGPIAIISSDSFRVGNNNLTITARTLAGCNVTRPFSFPVTGRPGVKITPQNVKIRCDQPRTSISIKAWRPAGVTESYNLDVQSPDTSFLTPFFNQDTVIIVLPFKRPQTVTVKAKISGSSCVTEASGTILFPLNASASASAYCKVGDTIRFSSSANSAWGIKSFRWDLGPGGISNLKSPKWLYPVSQEIDVTFIVEDSSTCRDTIALKINTFLPDTLASVLDDTICFNSPFRFSYGNSALINSWTWRGQSDSITLNSLTASNQKLTLKREGNVPVSVRIRYKGACTKRWTVDSVFVRQRVRVAFNINNVCAYDSTKMQARQITSEFPIVNWRWNHTWRDSSGISIPVDTGQNILRLFNKNLRLRTKLWAINSKGCADSLTRDTTMVLVSTPAFDINGSCQGDSLFFFFGRVPDRYENIRRFAYFFGDGESTINENGFAFHEYPNVGDYKVKLIAYSKEGCLNIDSTNLNIRPRPKVIYAEPNLFPCVGDFFNLDASASQPSSGPNEQIVSRRWWANSSLLSTTAIANTTFLNPGINNIAHWIRSTNGCTDSLRYWLVVKPTPVAGFEADPIQLLQNDFITFTNTSSKGSSWRYIYGDGNDQTFTDSTLASPSYFYKKGGEFEVFQIVKNDVGCSDTISKFFRMQPYIALPSAFTPNKDDINDVLELKHRLIKKLDELKVFNRFGQVVFETTDLNKNWDGKLDGVDVAGGSYIFVVQATSVFGETLKTKGTVNLIR